MNKIEKKLIQLAEDIINGKEISYEDALEIEGVTQEEFLVLLYAANSVRKHFRGNYVSLCSIINAKSGNCTEDCKFCAQSVHYHTGVKTYDLIDEEEIYKAAKEARKIHSLRLGIVTSGESICKKDELNKIKKMLKGLKKNSDIERCASLGCLTKEDFIDLKNAGLERFHHNLETARSFFPKVCTTHSYDKRVQTVLDAKAAGLKVCSGGIFGLGESFSQRVEFAFELKKLNVDSLPLNFLCPISGTPFENYEKLKPIEVLKIIAMFRLVLPNKEIKACAGRQFLGSFEPFIFFAGADGMMIGNFLTIGGKDPLEDLKMIEDLGLEI